MSTLSDSQKAQARRYLGVPDVSRQFDTRLESSFAALTTEGAELVCEILTELDGIKAKLKEARDCRLGIIKVEDITFRGEDEIRLLWMEGNRLAVDLGVAMYFTPQRRPFGTRYADWANPSQGASVARRG